MGADNSEAELEAAHALLDLSRVLMGITLRAVARAPVPVTVPQHRVLLMIAEDGPRRVGTLATDLGVNQSNASRIVDRLVGQGLARRKQDEADGRAALVDVTADGRALLHAVREHRLAALTDVVGRVPDRAHAIAGALRELTDAAAPLTRELDRKDDGVPTPMARPGQAGTARVGEAPGGTSLEPTGGSAC